MPAFRRVNIQVETSRIATQSITSDKEKIYMETATATIPPTAQYKTFTTAFGTVPQMYLGIAGTMARQVAGTPRIQMDILRVRKGSFQWRGTPNVTARWTAWGKL